MTANEWVMSLENPTCAMYTADRLWQQGLRASDREVLRLCYGYTDRDLDILCDVLQKWEDAANHNLKYYNPELGF